MFFFRKNKKENKVSEPIKKSTSSASEGVQKAMHDLTPPKVANELGSVQKASVQDDKRSDICLEHFVEQYNRLKISIKGVQGEDISEELLAVMVTIAHYISFVNKSDIGRDFRDKMSAWVYNGGKDEPSYGRFIQRRHIYNLAWNNRIKLRWEWLFSKANQEWANNEILRTLSLMMDFVINPGCWNQKYLNDNNYLYTVDDQLENYYSAPIMLREVGEYISASENIAQPLMKEFKILAINVYQDLYA